MCGARNPRLTLPVRLHPVHGEATTPALNVTLDASTASSGHSGLPLTTGASAESERYWAPLYRRSPIRRNLPGTSSKASWA